MGSTSSSSLVKLKRAVSKRSPAARAKVLTGLYGVARRTPTRPHDGVAILFASELHAEPRGALLRIHDRIVERGLGDLFSFRYSYRTPRTATKVSTVRALYLLATSDIVVLDERAGLLKSVTLSPTTELVDASRAMDSDETREVATEFFAQHSELAGKKMILFAPAPGRDGFRVDGYDYAQLDFEALYGVCGETSAVLFRSPDAASTPVPVPAQYTDRLIDISSWPRADVLSKVADVLITDYSPLVYEFAALNRPMVFFAYDLDAYGAIDQESARDYEQTVPGRSCTSFADVIATLRAGDFHTWKIDAFRREHVDQIDSQKTDRVVDSIVAKARVLAAAGQPKAS